MYTWYRCAIKIQWTRRLWWVYWTRLPTVTRVARVLVCKGTFLSNAFCNWTNRTTLIALAHSLLVLFGFVSSSHCLLFTSTKTIRINTCVYRNVIRCIHAVLIAFFLFHADTICARYWAHFVCAKKEQSTKTHIKYLQLSVIGMDRFIYYGKRSIRIIVVRATSCGAEFATAIIITLMKGIMRKKEYALDAHIRNCTSSKIEKSIQCAS